MGARVTVDYDELKWRLLTGIPREVRSRLFFATVRRTQRLMLPLRDRAGVTFTHLPLVVVSFTERDRSVMRSWCGSGR